MLMSYTKLNLEIEQYLKQHDLPFAGKATDTPAETAKRLSAYNKAREAVFAEWIRAKRYSDLVSCAHGGWFPYDEFTEPLARHFAAVQDWRWLKFLCERGIRFRIEDMLKCLQRVKESCPELTQEEMAAYDPADDTSFRVADVARWKAKALYLLDAYSELLQRNPDAAYVHMIDALREKTAALEVRKTDLKYIRTKQVA